MVVKYDGLVEYTCEKSNYNDIPPLEDVSDLEFAEEALVIRRALFFFIFFLIKCKKYIKSKRARQACNTSWKPAENKINT
jgi:hypothetical protein